MYKRATAKLIAAGISNITIVRRRHGASPEVTGVRRQTSRCFDSPDVAAAAVIGGYWPTDITTRHDAAEKCDCETCVLLDPSRKVETDGAHPGAPRTCSSHGDFEPCPECRRIRDRRTP